MAHFARLLMALTAALLLTPMARAEASPLRHEFVDFLVETPTQDWEPHIWEWENTPLVLMRRNTNLSRYKSTIITVVGGIILFEDPSEAGIRKFIENSLTFEFPNAELEIQPIDLAVSADQWPAAICVKYRRVIEEVRDLNGSLKFLTTWEFGYRCKHPMLANLVLNVSYSLRSDGSTRWTTFDEEADGILASMAFLPVDLRPQVVAALESYSQILSEEGNVSKAAKIAGYSKTLRKTLESDAPSNFLGFNQAEQLREFGALLSSRNDAGFAGNVANFANVVEALEASNFLCQTDKEKCFTADQGKVFQGQSFFWKKSE